MESLPRGRSLAVGDSVRDCSSGTADIEERGNSFQLVMAHLVKQIASSDDAAGFQREIHCQSRGAAAENPGNRIVFAPTSLQI